MTSLRADVPELAGGSGVAPPEPVPVTAAHRGPWTVQSVAVFEAAKGAVALVAATGLVLHRQVGSGLASLLHHLHLNPGQHHPGVFLAALRAGAETHLRLIAAGVVAYAAVRFTEALGLWWERPWALWLGALSATVYLPFELLEMARRPSPLNIVLPMLTGLVVWVLARRLRRATPSA